MHIVYILYSEKDSGLYVGCTSDIKERLNRHNSGHVPATRSRHPLVCIHTEEYELKAEAFNRERSLKKLWSANFKKKVKENYLNNRQSK